MTGDLPLILKALQFGDSGFPSGSFAFSWGLEGLFSDGMVSDLKDVEDLVALQLRFRWQTMDRLLLRQAFCASSLQDLRLIDLCAEASSLSAPLREGSRRAGRAMLQICSRLEVGSTQGYRQAVDQDYRLGHLPVVQGLVFSALGLPIYLSEMLGGWGLISGLASASIRLGILGHFDAQRVIEAAQPVLTELLSQSPEQEAQPSSFTPVLDIAVSRNAERNLRLFAT